MSQPVQEEVALVNGLIARDPTSVAQLFDQYHDLARGTAIRVLGSPTDADDLVQESFLIVIDKVGELRKPEALGNFIVSVVVRLARNELRKRAVRRFVQLGESHPIVLREDADPAEREQIEAIYRVLDRLDANNRILFVLRYVEGWELTDLAHAQNCSLATVKRRLTKANKRFRAIASREPALCDYLEEQP